MFRAWGFYMKLAKLIRSLGPGCLFGLQVLWMWGLAKSLAGLNLLENFNAVLSLVCSRSLFPLIQTVLQGNPEPLLNHGLAARSVTGEEAREASTTVTTSTVCSKHQLGVCSRRQPMIKAFTSSLSNDQPPRHRDLFHPMNQPSSRANTLAALHSAPYLSKQGTTRLRSLRP